MKLPGGFLWFRTNWLRFSCMHTICSCFFPAKCWSSGLSARFPSEHWGLTVRAHFPFMNSTALPYSSQRPAYKEPLWINKLSPLGGERNKCSRTPPDEKCFPTCDRTWKENVLFWGNMNIPFTLQEGYESKKIQPLMSSHVGSYHSGMFTLPRRLYRFFSGKSTSLRLICLLWLSCVVSQNAILLPPRAQGWELVLFRCDFYVQLEEP